MRGFFIKIGLYTLIYVLITFAFSDDFEQISNGEQFSLVNAIGKYVFFILAMLIFDFVIKKIIFRSNAGKNSKETEK